MELTKYHKALIAEALRAGKIGTATNWNKERLKGCEDLVKAGLFIYRCEFWGDTHWSYYLTDAARRRFADAPTTAQEG